MQTAWLGAWLSTPMAMDLNETPDLIDEVVCPNTFVHIVYLALALSLLTVHKWLVLSDPLWFDLGFQLMLASICINLLLNIPQSSVTIVTWLQVEINSQVVSDPPTSKRTPKYWTAT